MKRIYVGNLPFTATENEISDLFSQFGKVESVSVITDRDTGRPRGFAFVDMCDEDCDAAIGVLDGKEFGGRTLRVNEAREKGGGRGGDRRY